ncbi:hypothetical protein LHJ74_05625 [Streptomyces sp. N2-109]|uniref:Uncharacterized protein n=1 Tax=Streptomyces gossypii TaxID=2883101 RepID=A0ABT2JPH1_9ACTN|nr:hypothetical protein [Streptomyces gossypii]MCT2589414.1 hypothetical protein [Streptomyces gossypii]
MRGRGLNPLHLAGWLFADMLLVLALVSMGDQGDPVKAREAARGDASKSPSPSPSASPSPSPTPTGPRSVEREPVKVSIDAASSDRKRIVRELREVTQKYGGRKAAIVLTFGRTREARAGIAYAHRVNSLLDEARPAMFEKTTTRDFMDLGGSVGHADLEIYFFTR